MENLLFPSFLLHFRGSRGGVPQKRTFCYWGMHFFIILFPKSSYFHIKMVKWVFKMSPFPVPSNARHKFVLLTRISTLGPGFWTKTSWTGGPVTRKQMNRLFNAGWKKQTTKRINRTLLNRAPLPLCVNLLLINRILRRPVLISEERFNQGRDWSGKWVFIKAPSEVSFSFHLYMFNFINKKIFILSATYVL